MINKKVSNYLSAVIVLAAVFFVDSAYARLLVQSGTTTIPAGQVSAVVNITAVSSLSNAFLLMKSAGDSGATNSQNFQATGVLTATNQITFTRAGNVDDCQISWYVVEAELGEFQVVKRNTLTIATTGTTIDDAIGATIDQTRTFIASSSRIGGAGGTASVNKGCATMHFTNNTTVRATRAVSGTYTTVVSYEVIQWSASSGVTVQSKERSASIGTTQVTDTITTAVTPAQTWLYASFRHSSNGVSQTALDTYLVNGTTVGFKRYTGTYTSAIRWWAIQFPASVVVQRVTHTNVGTTAMTIASSISNVNPNYTWSDLYNSANATTTAFPRQAWYTRITAQNQITHTRFYNGITANLYATAIDSSAWFMIAPVSANANVVTTATVAAGESDILILDISLTNNMSHSDTISSVTVANSGTASDAEIKSVKLYYDSNNSGDYTSGVDQLVGSGTFTSGTKTFSGLNIPISVGGNEDLFVVLDVEDSVVHGHTLDINIPVNNIVFVSGFNIAASALNSGGTRAIALVHDRFVLSHDNTAVAGIAENVQVTAKDNKGNTLTNYTGTVTLDTNGTAGAITWAKTVGGGVFSDGGASLDTATYTFVAGDLGTATFTINDTKAETLDISVTGSGKTDDNTEGNLLVAPAAINHFVLSHDNTAMAGIAENVQVMATDAYGNILTGYTGTITLDTNGTASAITWTKASGSGVFVDGGSSVDTAIYTFDGADNGTATFTITDTSAESLNIAVTGGGKTDDNSEGLLIVSPAGIDHFVLAHDGAATAGITDNVSITVKDAYNNTITNYSGTITLDTNGTPTSITWAKQSGNGTFIDGGVGVDTANYTYVSGDNGVVVLTINNTKAEMLNIAVTGSGKADNDVEGNLTVAPGAIDYFVITHDGQGVTDIAEEVIVTAKDAYANTKTDYAGTIIADTNGLGNITWAKQSGAGVFNDGGAGNDTATYTYVPADNGVVVLTIRDDSEENLNISISGNGKIDDDTEGVLNIASSGINHFVISHDGNAIAGIAESITITAKNANNDTITTFSGTITLDTNGTATSITWAKIVGAGTFIDNGALEDTAMYTFVPADNGEVTLSLSDSTEETLNISVSGSGKTDDDTEGNLMINPIGLHHFLLSHDGAAVAGTAEAVTITAKDANGNTFTAYTGQITVDTDGTPTTITWAKQSGQGSFSDGGASADTATYTYVAGDNGVCVLTMADTKVETLNISVSGNGKSDNNTEGNIAVGPGAINYFRITHDGFGTAGAADNVTVIAYDAYGNIKTNYTGQITLDTNGTANAISWAKTSGFGVFVDGGASVDTATYSYNVQDNGSVILNLTDIKTESINISVIGDGRTDDNSEGNFSISPAGINYFKITHDGIAVAGAADAVTVTAYDIYNNIKTDYTGQITLDTNGTASAISWSNTSGNGAFSDGGAAVDTAIYTYMLADNGVVVFGVTDTKKEVINIQVAGDAKNDDDSEGNLLVSPATIDHFVVLHDGAAIVGIADTINVTAYDAYNNIKDNYVGTITLDTNGTAAAITWAKISGGGVFIDGGVAVDTATYTFVGADNGTATFSLNNTAAETINVSAQDGAYLDDNSEPDMVVAAGSIDYFVVGHDGTGIVDSFEPVSVTAKDQYGNTIISYVGTITLSTLGESGEITWALGIGDGIFNDNGAGVDSATYQYSITDSGVVILNLKDSIADTAVNVVVSGDGKSDENTEGNLTFTSSSIVIDNLDSGYSENSSLNSWTTRTTGNKYGSNWRRDTTINDGDWARWTPNITVAGKYEVFAFWSDLGVANATDSPYTVYYAGGNSGPLDQNQEVKGNQWNSLGMYAFAVGSGGYVELTDNANDDVCADAVKWVLIGSASASANAVTTNSVTAGQSDVLVLDVVVANNTNTIDTITALTVNNSGTLTDSEIASVKLYYDSDNSGTYSSGVDQQVGSGTFASGTKTFSGLTLTLTGNGTEYLFVVVDLATTLVDGRYLDMAIPANGITLINAPQIENSVLNSSGTRPVVLSLDHFLIGHDAAAQAGIAENVSVTARDIYGNVKSSYTGTIALDTNGTGNIIWTKMVGSGVFTDGGAGVDTAYYTFHATDNGTATFTITDEKAESVNIIVSGNGKNDDNSEGNIVFSPNVLHHFNIDHDNSASAGNPEQISIQAHDQYHNVINNYTGTITLDTNGSSNAITWALFTGFGVLNDGGASVDTATYTFSSSDNSSAVFTLTDTVAETLNISVSGDGKTDINDEGNLVVSPAALNYFLISHDGAAQAGVADNVVITAKDQYGNTLINYTGQITLDTNGTAARITWQNVSGTGVFLDGGVDYDTATYTYSVTDNGMVTLSLMDTSLESLNISVSGEGKFDDDSEGPLIVGPGIIEYFAITHDGFAVQNQAETMVIRAYDAYNNIKTDYSGTITVDTNGTANSITWALSVGSGVFNDGGASVDTATYAFSLSDNGVVTLLITDNVAEIINIAVSGNGKTDDDNEGVLEVVAAGFHHFKINHDGNAIVNVPESITITAQDASDITVTNYAGMMTVDTNGTAGAISWALLSGSGEFIDSGPGLDTATYIFDAADNGVVVLSITNTNQETLNISASGSGKTDDNSESNLVINPSGLNHFTIIHDNSAVAGVRENVTIQAHDANNNPVTGYSGTIALDTNGTAGTITWSNISGSGIFSDGGAAVDTAIYSFTAADNGIVILGMVNTKAESFNIAVSGDGKSDDNEEGDIIVSANILDKFVISHDGQAEAGIAENINIAAKDVYGNTLTNYAGQITVDTNGNAAGIGWSLGTGNGVFVDGGAGVDTATYTFNSSDNGTVILKITDITVELLNIAVSGGGKSDDNTEGGLVVGAGALNKFVIAHDGNGIAGNAEAVTITVYDIYGNVKTNYSGMITLDTTGTADAISWILSSGLGVFNDGGAGVDTATYTFVSADNGTAVFLLNNTKAETIDIDVSGNGKFDDDSEGNMNIAPAVLHHFKIAHDAQAMAGTAENISIYAKDIYDNTRTDYTGTISLDTNGTADKITWALVSGGGVFADGGALVDTAVYTFIAGDSGMVMCSLNSTAAETINITVAGDGKYDDNSEGDIIVAPAGLHHFLIIHDGQAIQSIAEEITVAAKDIYGNTKNNYTGTINLDTNGTANAITWTLNSGSGIFVDGGALVDTAVYTYAGQDNGVASFNLTDTVAQTINISVNDATITDDNTEGNLVVQASSVTVDISANALSSYYIAQSTGNNLVLDITLTNNNVQAADTIQSVTISNAGTVPDNKISSVKLYYDSNNSGTYSSGVDIQVGTGTFSGGSITFNSVNVQIPIAGTEDLYVCVDLSGGITDGATLDLSVPINGITFNASPSAAGELLNSGGVLTVDSGLPGNISNLTTSSHNSALAGWNNPQSRDNTVNISWSSASDSASGIDGYSILWDTNPATLPDSVKDIEESANSSVSPALGSGNSHYVHIRSVDNVGNWASSAVHLGPFFIDTQSPNGTSIYQITEYAGGDYLYVSGNMVYYSGRAYSAFNVYASAADSGSGLKEAQFPSTTSAGGIDPSEDVGAYQYVYTYTANAASASYANANIVVYDNAGNTTNIPFNVILDSSSPGIVNTLVSSTHTPNVSSSDNDISFTWSDVSDTQSGTAGYSIIVDNAPTTIPPQYRNVNVGVGTYTATDLTNGSYYVHIRAVDNVGNWSSAITHAGPYIIGRGRLNAALSTSKSIISTDQQFTVTMTVNNIGGSQVNNVDPSVLTVSSTGGATATTSSNPDAQNIVPAGQKQFQWTYTAGAMPGTINFKGDAQGTDSDGIIRSVIVSSSDLTVEQKASLNLSVSAAPSIVNTNENISITVTVSNSGQADALNVAPVLTPSGSANPIIDSGPNPATATIKGGRSKEFIFIAHGSGAGVASFTAGISQGIDENSNAVLTASQVQDTVTVQSPPSYALTSSISATPDSVQPAGIITITMNVQNTGSGVLNNITPSSLAVGGSSTDALYTSGPIPANIATLASGASQQFSWTYTAGSTLGIVNFTGNVSATEISSSASASNDITILTESAALASTIAATPASLLTNATITVTMTVTNTANAGGATATGVAPSIITIGGTSAQANLLTGPIPSSANIVPQSQQNFVWTYKAGINPGTVNFTANASGIDASSQADISSAANASANVSISTLSADWMYPTGANVLGPIRSIPIAYWGMENKIYIGSDDNNLYILNGDTHQLDASFTTSGKIRGLPYPSTDIDGADLKDIVYFGTVGKTVYGLWADNTLRWNRVMGESLTTTVLYDYVSGVYFGTTANNIYCIDAADGTDLWGTPAAVGGAIESSPAMIYVPTLDYDEIYFGASDGKVYGFKAIDGTGARTFDTGFGGDGAIKTAPTITLQNPSVSSSRRLMLFGTANGKFYAVNTANLSSSPANTGWTSNPVSVGGAVYSAPWFDTGSRYVFFGSQDGKLYAVSIADGSMKPNFPVDIGSPIDSWPLVENGIVYFGADNGKFYAVDIATGEIVSGWPYDTGGAIKGGAALHLIYNTETWDVQETYIIVGSDSGKVYSFRAVR